MEVIVYFWNWITQSVSFGLGLLNQFFNSPVTGPFMQLGIVVFAFGIIFRFILEPVFGNGSSDKAVKKKE